MNYTFEEMVPALRRGNVEAIEQQIESSKIDESRISGVNLHLDDNCQVILISNDFSRIYDLKDPNQSLDLADNLTALKFNIHSMDDQCCDWDLIDFAQLRQLPEIGTNQFTSPLFEDLNLIAIKMDYK